MMRLKYYIIIFVWFKYLFRRPCYCEFSTILEVNFCTCLVKMGMLWGRKLESRNFRNKCCKTTSPRWITFFPKYIMQTNSSGTSTLMGLSQDVLGEIIIIFSCSNFSLCLKPHFPPMYINTKCCHSMLVLKQNNSSKIKKQYN